MAESRLARTHWLTIVALTVAALLLRVPYRSALPYHWDSAEFALAMHDYNLLDSQPHTPGYFLYVVLGRLMNAVVGEPHAALVWVSVVAGTALVPVMYWLGRQMFDHRTGIVAACLALTSPQTWFHSEVALTYIVDALLVCVTVVCCWRAMARGGRWIDVVWIGAILAVVGGVRQQSVPALMPVVLYSFWRFESRRLAKLAVAGLVALGLAMAWFLPTVASVRGLRTYLEIVRRHSELNATATWLGGGTEAMLWNVFLPGLYALEGLLLAAVVLFGALLCRVIRKRQTQEARHSRALELLAVWVGGMIFLATLVGFTKQPGYVLNFLPGLFLLAAAAVAATRLATLLAVVVCGFNVFAFTAWPSSWSRVFYGTARTAREIREHDRQLGDTVAAIRAIATPDSAIILHAGEYLNFGFKQFQFLLPEFDQYQLRLDSVMLTPAGKPMMAAHSGRLQFVSGVDWTGRRFAILIVPSDRGLNIFEPYLDVSGAQSLPGANAYVIHKLPAIPH